VPTRMPPSIGGAECSGLSMVGGQAPRQCPRYALGADAEGPERMEPGRERRTHTGAAGGREGARGEAQSAARSRAREAVRQRQGGGRASASSPVIPNPSAAASQNLAISQIRRDVGRTGFRTRVPSHSKPLLCGELGNRLYDQSQESGVACPGFEPVAHSGRAELGECILSPLDHRRWTKATAPVLSENAATKSQRIG
jgi:hypothetical protein